MSYDSKYIQNLEAYSKDFNETFMSIIAKVKENAKEENKAIEEFETQLKKAKREDPTYLLSEFYQNIYDSRDAIKNKDDKFFLSPPFDENIDDGKYRDVILSLKDSCKEIYPTLDAVSKKFLWSKFKKLYKITLQYMQLCNKFV